MPKYALNQFMRDAKALWQDPAVPQLHLPVGERVTALQEFFDLRYGIAGKEFGLLHFHIMAVLLDYTQSYRPGIRRTDRIPISLLTGIFSLMVDEEVKKPTKTQIEEAEAAQAPLN